MTEVAAALAHIARDRLPWETGTPRTECGHDAIEFTRVLSREQATKRAQEIGQARSHYEFCVTCLQTVQRHATWDRDPLSAIGRLPNGWSTDGRAELARLELRAVGLLVQAHWEEYLATLDQLRSTVRLDSKRQRRLR
jgi:hypothetical protein